MIRTAPARGGRSARDRLHLVALRGRRPSDTARFRKALRTLGERVVEQRKARGWTQDQLAEEAELSSVTIGNVERAEMCCSLETLFQIAAALGVPTTILLEGLDSLVSKNRSDFL